MRHTEYCDGLPHADRAGKFARGGPITPRPGAGTSPPTTLVDCGYIITRLAALNGGDV